MLAPGGFFVVEIKSRPRVLDGDAHTWIWKDQGRETLVDHPLLLTNRKAKRLIALLKRQRAVGNARLPFLEPIVCDRGLKFSAWLPQNLARRFL